MKLINVKNDWDWIKNHAEKMIREDEKLEDEVLRIAREKRIEVEHIIELYHEGLRLDQESAGGEKGKYLSFKDWFHEFYQL